jgi:Lar family restriction alleviation protein
MTADLKPCPFCGSTQVESRYSSWEYYRVDCEGCGTSGPHADVCGLPFDEQSAAEALACDRWNRRAEGDAQRVKDLEAEVARLKDEHAQWDAIITEQFVRMGKALEVVRERLPSGEPARDNATEVEALVAKVERLKGELNNQECDTAYWKERAERLAVQCGNGGTK